jgi:hypothetical protein
MAFAALKWSWRRDLNPRPSDYKSDALPAELRQPNPPEKPVRKPETRADTLPLRTSNGTEIKVSTGGWAEQTRAEGRAMPRCGAPKWRACAVEGSIFRDGSNTLSRLENRPSAFVAGEAAQVCPSKSRRVFESVAEQPVEAEMVEPDQRNKQETALMKD